MVDHKNALAETALHVGIEQRLNLRTRLFCCVVIPERNQRFQIMPRHYTALAIID